MKVSTFLVIKAVISLLFGIGMAVLPGQLMNLYGVTLDSSGIGFCPASKLGIYPNP